MELLRAAIYPNGSRAGLQRGGSPFERKRKGNGYLFRSKIALPRSRIPRARTQAKNLCRAHEDGMRFACLGEHFA